MRSETLAPLRTPLIPNFMSQKLSIAIKEISFQYNAKTEIFNGHSLLLEVPHSAPNKLYGIIGPSGTGKTTLLSILGGQLNPSQGSVSINDTNIYQVNDEVRIGLIAIQMQTSSNLRGSLRFNVLFGLPGEIQTDDKYSDAKLIEVLDQVGIWAIFADKDGLDTLIGEGGMNLSGGQRQRLNFAALYLRVQYYKPALVLIDEPTSSLDEISERAITKMINEIAAQSITMVIAHRIQTLNSAVALLDSSLIEQSKGIEFLTRQELENVSQYYQDLQSGKAHLDD
jgi:ABC-type multidrug transport system fused ATPase/permease subunit